MSENEPDQEPKRPDPEADRPENAESEIEGAAEPCPTESDPTESIPTGGSDAANAGKEPPELPTRISTDSPIPGGYDSMTEAPGLATVVDALLKSPTRLLYECQEGRRAPAIRSLAIIAGVAFLVFGLLLGLFSGGGQLWIVPVKIFAGALVSGAITLPSLYVFSSLGGLDMTLPKASGLMLSGLALIGVILLGLAPVLWIFTQSTDSIGFMGFLVLAFWLTACGFGLSLIRRSAKVFGNDGAGYLVLWAVIFLTVTLQMSTSLRPLLGPSGETILPTEKRFFLEHWITVVTGDGE